MWNRLRRKRASWSEGDPLHEYVFSTRKNFDPVKILAEMIELVPSIHSIEIEKGRLTAKSTMPCNDVDRRSLLRAMRKHKAKGSE